ncbi:MAG: TolC family protein [Firmicutes bacterium]|nr:TolC family protein [Bacillota bacterium]
MKGESIVRQARRGRKTAAQLICCWITAILALMPMTVFGQEAPATEADVISIETALELAMDHSLSLATARLEMEYAQKQLAKAQADAAIAPSPVAMRQAEFAVESQRLVLEKTQRQVELQVKNAYFGLTSKMQQRAVAAKNHEQVEEQLRIIRVKYSEGLATKLDLLNSEKALLEAQGSLEAAQAEEELALLEFKRVLGLPYTEEIRIEPSDVQIEPIDFSSEQVIEKVLKNDPELVRLQWALEISQMQEESAKNEYTAPLIKDMYTNRRMKAELDLKDGNRIAFIQAKQMWNSLKQAENRVALAKKELEAAEENYRITKVRFDGGLEIPNNLLRAQISLTSAQYGLVNAIFEYNLAHIRVLNLMGE